VGYLMLKLKLLINSNSIILRGEYVKNKRKRDLFVDILLFPITD